MLEIGTGSGHMAALMARQAQQVHTMEIQPALAALARRNLQRAAVTNVQVHEADGAQGLPDEAPFDAIALSGSVPELPQALLQQLKVSGRLVAIVGFAPVMNAVLVTRSGESQFDTRVLFDIVTGRLHGFAEPTRFRF